jgi:arylsulfatase A-like enzyme
MKNSRPNFLVLLADQMQAGVLDPAHPCQTPNLDRLRQRGLQFTRAYAPSATCSPSRASLMTGLLPHNHGVQWVTHSVQEDQGLLRSERRHWAQTLREAGYDTAYFGKWHVERTERPEDFGWNTVHRGPEMNGGAKSADTTPTGPDPSLLRKYGSLDTPDGYPERILYAVSEQPLASRSMTETVEAACHYLESRNQTDASWCCCISLKEPHDPFICSAEAYARYDADTMPLPANWEDPLTDKPGLYRRSAGVFSGLGIQEVREARTCYFASVTEVDTLWGQLLDLLESRGMDRDTIVIVTSDHGELLGAHGLFCKNISAFEEIYNIPLLMAGPGIPVGQSSRARVGLHDLHPTIISLAGIEAQEADLDARSFTDVFCDPHLGNRTFTEGYAEYHGSRFLLTQRIYWEDNWKFVFNGFDFDELYDLENDPNELHNLAGLEKFYDRTCHMMRGVWRHIMNSRDATLINTSYPPLRIGICGPETD